MTYLATWLTAGAIVAAAMILPCVLAAVTGITRGES